jgi:hypothetical protein
MPNSAAARFPVRTVIPRTDTAFSRLPDAFLRHSNGETFADADQCHGPCGGGVELGCPFQGCRGVSRPGLERGDRVISFAGSSRVGNRVGGGKSTKNVAQACLDRSDGGLGFGSPFVQPAIGDGRRCLLGVARVGLCGGDLAKDLVRVGGGIVNASRSVFLATFWSPALACTRAISTRASGISEQRIWNCGVSAMSLATDNTTFHLRMLASRQGAVHHDRVSVCEGREYRTDGGDFEVVENHGAEHSFNTLEHTGFASGFHGSAARAGKGPGIFASPPRRQKVCGLSALQGRLPLAPTSLPRRG